MSDVSENAEQLWFGVAEQYLLSTNNAQEISAQLGYSELTFVGHSLGGGLASANALTTGDTGITFNAAGLSDKTKEQLSLFSGNAYIKAFIVQGEIVDQMQTEIGIRAEGIIVTLPPPRPYISCLLYTSPSPRDKRQSRMPSSA